MPEIVIGQGEAGLVTLDLSRANRHGLIAGATGTGKTVTLQTLAEQFARAGVNVLACDIKGDLAGLAMPGDGPEWAVKAYENAGLTYMPTAARTVFWDVEGKAGETLRLSLEQLGPVLLARLLDLNTVQGGVLQIVFKLAEDKQWPLADLADLRAVLAWMGANDDAVEAAYGQVSGASIGAIQRALLGFENEGGDALFGEPAFDVEDLLRPAGVVHVLHAVQLMQRPRSYGVLLLFILTQLFERLPEAGDLPQPKLCLLLDEAHLMFKDAPKPLMEKVEQVVRLIRSKGVGVYFVTQQPGDVPEAVLAQLGNRIQHALRAATPQGQQEIKAAARTMAANPAFKTEEVLPQLAVGEALVSVLDRKGVPQPVVRVKVIPPQSRVGVLSEAERASVVAQSPVRGRYAAVAPKKVRPEAVVETPVSTSGKGGAAPAEKDGWSGIAKDVLLGSGRRQGLVETAAKTVVRQVASQAGRALLRGLLSGLKR